MIRLFVFDLGNVILPFEHRQIATKLHRKSKLADSISPGEMFDHMFDRAGGLVNRYETGNMSSYEFFDQLRDMFRLDMDFEEFKDIWNNIFWENKEVIEAIEYLKGRGYPLFLLSDTNELHFTYIIGRYPVVHLFDEWILSFEVGVKKPEKRIYDVIFEKSDTEGKEVLYIDDMERNVEAAEALGMQGLVFSNAEELWRIIKDNSVGMKK
ncbi:MAG: HAD family phosphatase [Syntrophorhabdaceae bacterium]|nr:HAD family phosphatase [Syntrophorhabdaceae bacterium]